MNPNPNAQRCSATYTAKDGSKRSFDLYDLGLERDKGFVVIRTYGSVEGNTEGFRAAGLTETEKRYPGIAISVESFPAFCEWLGSIAPKIPRQNENDNEV